MVYTALAGLVLVVALIVVLFAGRLLFKSNWLLGWLRGMLGLLLLGSSAVLALSAVDFYSYRQLSTEETIASISFTKLESQHFKVSLVDSSGVEQTHDLRGDLWQLDARFIKWNKSLAGLGLTPGYRLDRLSGRYYSLEEEHSAERTVHSLGNSKSVLDVWAWLQQCCRNQSFIDASYGSATYLPMADGALFAVNLSGTGLLARPLNDRAKAAVEAWQ